MIQVTVLQLAVSFWKRSLSISKKLSGRTWVALAVTSAAIAAACFWAYRAETVPESAIPPVVYEAQSDPTDFSKLNASRFSCPDYSLYCWSPIQPGGYWKLYLGSPSPAISMSTTAGATTGIVYGSMPSTRYMHMSPTLIRTTGGSFTMTISGSNFNHATWTVRVLSPGTQLDDWFHRLPGTNRITVEAPPPQAPSLLDVVSKEAALIVSIITAILAIMNGFFAWMVYKRAKAQQILLQLQIAKITAELEQMRAQEAKARQESEKSPLILLS